MRYTITLFILILCLAAKGQTPTFSSNFEDQNTAAEYGTEFLETSAGGFTVEANPDPDDVNGSSYVLRAYLNEGKGRAEYSSQSTTTNEKRYIYTWSRYHETDMYTDVNVGWMLFNQWKTWPCEAAPTALPEYAIYDDYICGQGGIFNEIDWEGGDDIGYWSRAYPDCQNDYTTIDRGEWTRFVLEIYWTNTDNGYFRIWKNDVLFGSGFNMKTLFDEFLQGTCDIYWSNGLYAYWAKSGGGTTNQLEAYIDDIAIYDVASGYNIADICPTCEGVSEIDFCDTVTFSASADVTNSYFDDGDIDQTVINLSVQSVSHLWSNGATTEDLTNISAGAYSDTITLVDSGCVLIKSYIIDQLDTCYSMNITATTVDETNSQNNGSINTTVTGGTSPFTYLWNDESILADRSGLEAGTYSVTVTDDIGCTDIGEWTISNEVTGTEAPSKSFIINGGEYFNNGKAFMR